MTVKTSLQAGAKGNLLAILAGAIFPLGLAPLNLWPLIPVSLACLMWLLKGQSPRHSMIRAILYGVGFNGVGVSWVYVSIHYYGHAPMWLAGLGTAGFVLFLSVLLFALPFWAYRRFNLDHYEWLTFPAIWVLIEWVKSWLLSGFPWLWAGYGLIESPAAPLAPVTGVLGLSLVAALSAAMIRLFLRKDNHKRLPAFAALAIMWLACWGLSTQQWTQIDLDKTRKVSLIQGNIPQEMKWNPSARDSIINTYKNLTAQSWDADFILWPEAAFPVYYEQALDTIRPLDKEAKKKGVTIVSGIPRWQKHPDRSYTFYNSIFVMGDGDGFYDKQKLVPFGEYVPMADVIRGLIPFFDLPMSSFTEGKTQQSPLIAGGLNFAAFICYEIVYPELVRRQAADQDFLVTISNDAWFGHSWGPLQHFQMARMRALETGKYLLRGTNTGITAIIDHKGNVQSRLPQFEQGVLKGVIYGTQGITPFVRWGQWPILVICGLLLLIGAALAVASVKNTSPQAY